MLATASKLPQVQTPLFRAFYASRHSLRNVITLAVAAETNQTFVPAICLDPPQSDFMLCGVGHVDGNRVPVQAPHTAHDRIVEVPITGY